MTKRPLLAAFLICVFAAALGRYAPVLLPVCAALAGLYAFAYEGLPPGKGVLRRVAVAAVIAGAAFFVGYTCAWHLKEPVIEKYFTRDNPVKVLEVSNTKGTKGEKGENTRAVIMGDFSDGAQRRAVAYFDGAVPIKPGDVIVVTGEFEPLSFPRNPGAYDEFIYLRARKIYFKMYLSGYAEGGKFFSPLLSPFVYAGGMNAAAAEKVGKLYPEDGAGVMRAMLLGDKTALNGDLSSLYSEAGIYHILAISGMHVAIVGMAASRFIAAAARFLFKRRRADKAAAAASVAVMACYAVFTGFGPSTARAVIMASCVAFSGFFGEKGDTYSSISLAGIILLIYEPLYIFDAGFLYSFASVFGLALLSGPSERLFGFIKAERPRKIAQKYLGCCIAAFAATVPVTAWFFYKVSPVSIIVNAALLPTVAITVVCGFVSLVFPPASFAAYGLLRFYGFVCAPAVKIPFGVILIGRPHIAAVVLFCAALVIWGVLPCVRKRERAAPVVCLALSFAVFFGARAFENSRLTVTFLDVGQGDSAALSLNGRIMLIDGGGNFLDRIGENTGSKALEPYLDYKGAKKADAAVVTHMDADHAIGIIELLKDNRIKEVYLGNIAYAEPEEGADYADGNMHALITEAARKNNVKVTYISEGDVLTFAGGVKMAVLNPPPGMTGKTNDQSIVARAEYNGVSIMFTGDAESGAEGRLTEEYGSYLSSDILKVGHHGSKTSSTPGFLAAVRPKAAVISVGSGNKYGHPNEGVVERLGAAGADVYTTAGNGAVTFVIKGGNAAAKTMSDMYGR